MPRTPIVTKEKFKKALVGTGGIMLNIANNVGVSRNAIYQFCNKYPEMMELRRLEEEKIIDIGEGSLFTKAKDGFLGEGFCFAGANAYRVEEIVSVKKLMHTLDRKSVV